jgi:hypothetical protein
MLFTSAALDPLSSLPRDGGDVRGGSSILYLVAVAIKNVAIQI